MSIDRGDTIQWWGYRHTSGSLQVKRWFGDPLDIQEAKESPFCAAVSQPFDADNREDALRILEGKV